jgi:hypothetical protein
VGDVSRIIEAGHYYQSKGPTEWSQVGWSVMQNVRAEEDKTMIFVDDFHTLKDVSQLETDLPVVDFHPHADYTVMESAMVEYARDALGILQNLPKRRRARTNRLSRWYCSGFAITDNRERPLCLLLDLGLSLYKWRMLGFCEGINIVPCFYEEEQRRLCRLMAKAVPSFSLEVLLYDLRGKHWKL